MIRKGCITLQSPFSSFTKMSYLELIHEQLPLPVPCYDLFPVTKFTFGPAKTQRLRVPPAPLNWRAVSTRLENVFTAACWSAITSDSGFMRASCSPQSVLGEVLKIGSTLPYCSSLYFPLYHVCSPGYQRDMLIWRHPLLPPPSLFTI